MRSPHLPVIAVTLGEPAGVGPEIVVEAAADPAVRAAARCFVVGDEVVASMRRQAPEGDFRSNLHRGGTALHVAATDEERVVAIRAARVLGLGVAGVDLIRAKRGPLVLEVNSTPGLEGIEAVCGVDVAGGIVEHLAIHAEQRG